MLHPQIPDILVRCDADANEIMNVVYRKVLTAQVWLERIIKNPNYEGAKDNYNDFLMQYNFNNNLIRKWIGDLRIPEYPSFEEATQEPITFREHTINFVRLANKIIKENN
jgi:hypothetical protein